MKEFSRNFPLSRPHCGVPMGNGQLGVLVWGQDNICLTVNRSDYWDHRCGESYLGPHYKKLVKAYDPYDVEPINSQFIHQKMPFDNDSYSWRSTRLPCGRFELNLRDGIKPRKAVLDYNSGTVRIHCDNNEYINFHVDIKQDLLLIEDGKKLVNEVKFISAWEYVSEVLEKADFAKPEKIDCGEIQSVPEDFSLAALCSKREYGYAITLQRGEDNTAAFEKAKEILNKQISVSRCTSGWWDNYWKQLPKIDIPDEFLNDFYKFALYKFACATHPNGIACGLQGPWVEEYQKTPWSGDYHFNVNIQQIYTLAFATGNFEHLMPLFDMLESESFKKTMRDNARNMFGIDDGLLLTHAVDDRGMQCGGISVGSSLDFACGGWTAQLYWLYYKYTLDENFLKNRALPFIKGVMRVFEETLEERDEKLSIPLSISAEYGCTFKVKKNGRYVKQNSGRDPSNQLACMHMLADFLLEASKISGEKPKEIWKNIKLHLPLYTLSEDEETPNIAIWEGQDLDVCHRHHSHLACIYPFDTLPNPTAEQQEVIENSIDHWILCGMGQWSEWCYPWAAIIQARMGFKESPAILLNLWKEIFINEGMATAYLPRLQGLTAHRRADMLKPRETNEVMQLDGTMAGATAIIEMLVHQKGDTVYLFKGIPDKWLDAHFENVRLPGAFTISAVRKNGELESIRVKSIKGGKFKISLNNQIHEFVFKPDEEKAF
jgi:alpha-L-fucosidase 2